MAGGIAAVGNSAVRAAGSVARGLGDGRAAMSSEGCPPGSAARGPVSYPVACESSGACSSAPLSEHHAVVGGKDLFGVCPYITAQTLLQGKWSILILHHLAEGPVRFNELQRRIPRMTHATLSRALKQMEADRLIERHDLGTVPPCVEYSLSPSGRDFLPVLDALRGWGERYIERVAEPSERMRAQAESYQ